MGDSETLIGQCRHGAEKAGCRLSKNVQVCQEIERLRAETASILGEKLMDATEVLQRLAKIARDEKDKDHIKALELLGKNHKLWVERIEQTTTSVEEGVKARTDARLAKLKLVS